MLIQAALEIIYNWNWYGQVSLLLNWTFLFSVVNKKKKKAPPNNPSNSTWWQEYVMLYKASCIGMLLIKRISFNTTTLSFNIQCHEKQIHN